MPSDRTDTESLHAACVEARAAGGRRYVARYALLTAALFLPLLWAFAEVRNLYPFAAWTVMLAGGGLERGRDYYVLRGETLGGEVLEVRAAELTDSVQAFSMVAATVGNAALRLQRPHPANAALVEAAGGVERVPRAARLPELLRAWGGLYNERLPADSPRRLKAVRLDAYRWEGGAYADYDRPVESWRVEL